MSQVTFVGIDVSAQWLDIYLHPQAHRLRLANDPGGFLGLMDRLRDFTVRCIVLEATGNLEYPLVDVLQEQGLPVAVINPRWVRDFARAKGILSKTDRIDARVLAVYAESMNPVVRESKDEKSRKLSALVSHRQVLADSLVAEQNRLKRAHKAVCQVIQDHMGFLEEQIATLEKQIEAIIQADTQLKQQDKLMRTIPGVGKVLSATFLAQLTELGQVNRGQISSLVGVSPRNRDSGKRRKKRCIWGGRASVRRVLYMGTMSAIRFNPGVKAVYDRMRKKGLSHKEAMVPSMRKLLSMTNGVVKTGTPWRQNNTPVLAA